MHTLKCKSIEELVEVVVETYELLHDCDRNVSFVAKYDHAKEILRELVFYDYDLKFVELADPEWDNYEDEYVISIVRDEIFCEKLKLDGRYCMLSPKFVFFDENANSKCVKYFESDMKYEFEITEEESSGDSDHMIDHHDCDDYDCDSRSKDNSMNVDFSDDGQGFTCSKHDKNGYSSISYWSSEQVDKVRLSEILKSFYL